MGSIDVEEKLAALVNLENSEGWRVLKEYCRRKIQNMIWAECFGPGTDPISLMRRRVWTEVFGFKPEEFWGSDTNLVSEVRETLLQEETKR